MKEFKIKVTELKSDGSCRECFLDDIDVNCEDICPGGDKILLIDSIIRVEDKHHCAECDAELKEEFIICSSCFYK